MWVGRQSATLIRACQSFTHSIREVRASVGKTGEPSEIKNPTNPVHPPQYLLRRTEESRVGQARRSGCKIRCQSGKKPSNRYDGTPGRSTIRIKIRNT